MPSDIVIECSHTLKDRELTISFAESITAGKLISEFALIPNCGSVLVGSVVSYDSKIKEMVLNVPGSLIEEFTAESAQVSEQMAIGLQKVMPADVNVAVTGLAAPGGSETPEKPVGTMFVHGFIKDKAFKETFFLTGEPGKVILKTVYAIAGLILRELAASA